MTLFCTSPQFLTFLFQLSPLDVERSQVRVTFNIGLAAPLGAPPLDVEQDSVQHCDFQLPDVELDIAFSSQTLNWTQEEPSSHGWGVPVG